MSGDLQARKRKGKAKRKDEFDDDVAEVKNGKAALNGSHRSQTANSYGGGGSDGGGGGGSGVVAKVVFLVLLVALSLVVALIIVELRAGMRDMDSVVPEAVFDAPDTPQPPVLEESLPAPPLPTPVLQEPDVEEYEPLEATPPLEEYVKVAAVEEVMVEEVVEEVVEAPVVVEKVEEVPEVVEEPEVVKIVEEVEAPRAVEEIVPQTVVDEVPVVEEVVEVIEVVEQVEEPVVEVVEVVEIIEEVTVPAQEEEAVEEVVEKVAEVVETSEDEPAAEPTEEDDEEEEEEEEEEEDPTPKIVEEEEDEEDWSQYGKEGSTADLTDAYLHVENLASEVLASDPENPMVAQLTPHLAGVLRAMEEGRTEGLLDTLRHIETILSDIKERISLNQAPTEKAEVVAEVVAEAVAEAVAEEVAEPVAVDEIIPDPIHVEPLQDDAKVTQETQPPVYIKADITSDVDNNLREELDAADDMLARNPGQALNAFGAILHRHPKSARAIYGRARSMDRLAEVESSNSRLEQAIVTYRSILDLADEDPTLVPLPLLRAAADRCIDRMSFRGFVSKAVRVLQRLIQRFPEDLALHNKLGVSFLMMNQGAAAKEVFEGVLQKWPDSGYAQVHYGFVLKTVDSNNTGGAIYLQSGISSGDDGTQDARFFYHLGDALQRQGRDQEAYKLYDQAVEKGMFLNRYQRSLYNVDRLTSRPIWSHQQTTYQVFFRNLEENWEAIRDESLALMDVPEQDGFWPEKEKLHDRGDWKQYELFKRGRKVTANCVKTPKTCALIEHFAPAAGCKRGQVKFSLMAPGTHVHAHTGPTNCRLRAHLGLVVPSGLKLRVGNETKTWEEGKLFIFDDSYEHEVWHDGSTFRLILIVDVWHPELTEEERKSLYAI